MMYWIITGWPFQSCPEKKVKMNTVTVFARMVQHHSFQLPWKLFTPLCCWALFRSLQLRWKLMLLSTSKQLNRLCADIWHWLLIHVLGAICPEAVLSSTSVTQCAALLFLVWGNSSSFWVHLEEQYKNGGKYWIYIFMALVELFLCPALNPYLNVSVCFKPYSLCSSLMQLMFW